ncbi:DUF6414 family protein [Nocardia asiatica]|uniref:DUF6414 family protein n=1 Tax=Nocardia asiatica TaxID=209252 RepID=UPI002455C6B5|nr:hypothetical protein [Nocardia asiatica]
MPANLPESDVPDLREYLFVDEPRVKMLVSQLRGGAPERSTLKNGRSARLRVGLKTLGTEHEKDRSEEDTLALSDLFVSMLEEDAEALGMLTDLSERAGKRKFWLRGGLRQTLEPGMLLRVTAPTRLMDASGALQVWRRFDAANSSVNLAGSQNNQMSAVLDMIEALYGENLALTVLPCGVDEPDCAFLGVVGHDTESAALDRPSLLSRLGPEAPELTSILQIARTPTERDQGPPPNILIGQMVQRLQGQTGFIDRSAIDQLLFGMMRMTEDVGLQSAPKWPAVSVTPLAIYRQVPRALVDELREGPEYT